MGNSSNELLAVISSSKPKFAELKADDWSHRSAPGKWSKKEILGHLIDSAANNHQRFVRIQFEDNPRITYDQNNWVKVQEYNYADGALLIDLWSSYNTHLAHIMRSIPEQSLSKLCDINKEEPVTLEWLAKDYIKHLQHHINQII